MAEAIVLRSVKGSPLTHTEMDNNFINPFRNLIDGLITSNSTDTDHDISVSVGVFSDSTNARTFETTSAIVKQIDVNWAEGTAAGGFPSGLTLTADTWYHFFMVAKPDGTVDAGWDTSLSATNLLADTTGFTLFRRVASHLTDGSSNIMQYLQRGDGVFRWDEIIQDLSATDPGTTTQSIVMTAPLGVITMIQVFAELRDSSPSGVTNMILTGGGETTNAVTNANRNLLVETGSIVDNSAADVPTDTSSRVKYRLSQSTTGHTVRLKTEGYRDFRGKE